MRQLNSDKEARRKSTEALNSLRNTCYIRVLKLQIFYISAQICQILTISIPIYQNLKTSRWKHSCDCELDSEHVQSINIPPILFNKVRRLYRSLTRRLSKQVLRFLERYWLKHFHLSSVLYAGYLQKKSGKSITLQQWDSCRPATPTLLQFSRFSFAYCWLCCRLVIFLMLMVMKQDCLEQARRRPWTAYNGCVFPSLKKGKIRSHAKQQGGGL